MLKPVWEGDTWKDTAMGFVWAIVAIIGFAIFFSAVSFVLSWIA
jgi:hypothetical protein